MEKTGIILVDILDDPEFDTLELFTEACNKAGISKIKIKRIDGLRELEAIYQMKPSGLIISGSRHNISDGVTDWMSKLCDLVLKFHGKIPMLGVCFGHQILARAFGGGVEKHSVGKEIGSVDINLTPDASSDSLFDELSSVVKVQMTHGDVVTSVPLGATLLAGNDYCKVQAFRLSDTWGIQFHSELTPETFKSLLRNRIRELIANGNHESVGHYQEILDQLVDCPDGYRVLGKFIKYCLERRK